MAAAIQVVDSFPEDWTYISEGGAMIVFSYTGSPHPQYTGNVLRLRKARHDAKTPDIKKDVEDQEEPDDPTVIFQRDIIARLIPAQYLPRLENVRVDSQWLQRLAELCEAHRPQERRRIDGIDIHKKKAVLATNLVGTTGWAVEIKPKWGFLPSPTYLSSASRDIKMRTCRFCMHAHLKNTKGEQAAVEYCPLDLFSGKEARAQRAIYNLWDAWIASEGKINNLKVFVQGKILKPTAESSSLNSLASQLKSTPLFTSVPSLHPLRDKFASVLLPLLSSPVLPTLAQLQRTLDPLDIEGLSALWEKVYADRSTPLGSGIPEPTLGEWIQFLDSYLKDPSPPVGSDSLRYYCLAYLLSATFKDCSIILHLPGSLNGTGAGQAMIAVVDLDVKRVGRLRDWVKLDAEILEAHKISEPKLCTP